jgi:mono/diheme cytochrome c family protein
MRSPSKLIRPLLVLAALAGVVVAASGCGTTSADTARGRVLFVQRCGVCHAMAEAGSQVHIGPDLDGAFAAAREIGENSDTIEGIVKAQVENPRPVNGNSAVSMPPDLATGQDLDDIAAYVGTYAGVPGAAPPTVPGGPGAQVFANSSCGGCHTLKAAKSGGVTGPNLDEVLPGQTMAMIHEDIADPNKDIAKGYPPDVMPQDYEQTLTAKELEDLVQYLFEETSGGKKGSAKAAGSKSAG